MKRARAEKHLRRAHENLQYWREAYVETMRDPNWRRLDTNSIGGRNYFEERLAEIRENMEEAKVRVAKFERIVR